MNAAQLTTFAMLACLLVSGPVQAAGRPVQLHASDGTALAATVYAAAVTPAPAVVLVHMLTRTKEDWIEFAEQLQDAGATVLAVDLRGHGSSAGSASPSSAMARDVTAAVTWLTGRADVRAVAVVGASFGATVAALAGADLPDVRGLALLSPSENYRGVRLSGAIRKFGSRPLLLVASAEDPYALRTVRDLTEDAASGHEQRISLVAAHGSHLVSRDPEIAAALVDWLRRTLVF